MKYGYARVSSPSQDPGRQVEALTAAGADEVIVEVGSGGGKLPLRKALRAKLTQGDVVLVTRLDRWGRSIVDLCASMASLREQGIGFKVLEQPVDTTTSTGRLVAGILAAVAEFELEIRRERQREGIDRAKREGVYRGRRPVLTPQRERRLVELHLSEGVPVKQLAKEEGVSRATLYRAIQRGRKREGV